MYRTDDLKGLEVAGSVKNVMAIAAGMINGLDLGFNTTAALVTRANMEISATGHQPGRAGRKHSGAWPASAT